ncbi:restriction endonuclease subunit M [Salmonella enterica subsp. enterica serovar Oranienburg]|nr:restriction endonuclease subunit M [Salmonella enterica subsp. enterica serovar Oranienburg]
MIKLLSEVAEVTGGHTFRTKAEAASGHVRLLQIKDIQESILTDFSALPFADIQPEKLKINLQTNDILLPLRGERIPAMMIVNQQSTLVTTTNQIAVIRVNSLLINPEYLYYFFNSPEGDEKISALQGGGLVVNLSLKKLLTLEIPIPLRPVQDEVIGLRKIWNEQKKTLEDLIENGTTLCHTAINRLIYRG